ncbi:Uu.00g002320.m01.CDS01 [Anthostomella pinea]|uniref:Uu.00g002320.m01.CDS01 n=1 Tax=Anthostomella pinea TaxID=933095 RepID=A0AAI8VK96_9PEZI|nr:Uu.00g002320.m01.CDS01 [Anthostomella pinea]
MAAVGSRPRGRRTPITKADREPRASTTPATGAVAIYSSSYDPNNRARKQSTSAWGVTKDDLFHVAGRSAILSRSKMSTSMRRY